MMAYTLMSAVVMIGVVLIFITPGRPVELLPMVVGVALGAIIAGTMRVVGYQQQPLPLDKPVSATAALAAYRSGMMLRFALAESVALISFALTVGFRGNVVSYLPGAAISLVLLFLDVLPNRTNVRRVEERLDRDGARSGLSALFGY